MHTEPSVIVAGPQDIITSSNLKLSATCVAWGKPLPTITWTSSYTNLTSFNTYTTSVSDGQFSYVVSILEICPTSFITSDTYTCTASSTSSGTSLGLTSSSFVLQGNLKWSFIVDRVWAELGFKNCFQTDSNRIWNKLYIIAYPAWLSAWETFVI